MKKLLTWIILPPIAVVVIAFAIANRGPVTVSLSPLPVALDLPLYWVVLAAVLVGLIAGGTAAWASGAKWRRLAREKRRQAGRLEAEVESLRRAAPAPAGLPAARPEDG